MAAPNAPVITGQGLVFPSPALPDMLLRAPYGRFLALCHEQFLALGPSLQPALRPLHAQLVGLVRRALAAHSPRAVLACYAAPTISTALQCTRLADALPQFAPAITRASERTLAHLGLELAARKLLEPGTQIEIPSSLGPFTSPTMSRTFHLPDVPAVTLRADGLFAEPGHAVRFERPDEPEGGFRTERSHVRTHAIRFAFGDHNPIAAFEAHPDKQGNHVTLGERPADEWQASLSSSFELIERYTPELFREMAGLLHEVVPVGFDREKHLSASYREAIGTVYLTLHPHVMTMTEALIHEFQHNKLNLASYFEDFLINAFEPLYKSPVRPDPRPLWGILLAVHAFLPVAVLYRRMRDAGHPHAQRPDFLARMDAIDLKNHEGMEMLRAHGEFTPAGKVLMSELDVLCRKHMAERAARGLADTPTESHVA